MRCLHCGDCCRRMPPPPLQVPCQHLIEPEPGLYLCSIYEQRPEACRAHEYHSHTCPIGVDVLRIEYPDQAHARIDRGWELCGRATGRRGGEEA